MTDMAPTNGEQRTPEFVRNSATPEGYDGLWQVWDGAVMFGWVRKASDPVDYRNPWGYESLGTIRWPGGARAGGGFPTRKAAGIGLVKRVLDDGGLRGTPPASAKGGEDDG